MVPRRLSPWTAALLVLVGLSTPAAHAAPINNTGFVTQDFNPATNPSVTVTPVSSSPLNIGQSQWITNNGWVSGWSIQDIRTYYDSSTDTMYVGVNTFANKNGQYAPFGQANGDPSGSPTPYDPAHLGGDKSIAVAFAPVSATSPTSPGTPVIVAGVPADKTVAGTGTDGFTVSSYNATTAANGGLAYSFGKTLPQFTGNLAADPSSASPTGVHDQELQPDSRPEWDQRLLDLGLRRLGRRRGGRRGLPGLDEDPRQCPAEYPGADHLAGMVAGQRPGGLAIPEPPEPGSSMRFDPSNQ